MLGEDLSDGDGGTGVSLDARHTTLPAVAPPRLPETPRSSCWRSDDTTYADPDEAMLGTTCGASAWGGYELLEVKAPNYYMDSVHPWLFLCGSIEMGRAVDWQTEVAGMLQSHRGTILNPRRNDWDNSWLQAKDNRQFREQVEWELSAQAAADLILVYFAPGTYSPITLLELGLFSKDPKQIVVCPEGFWRKGNVDIVCEWRGILQVDSLEAAVREILGT